MLRQPFPDAKIRKKLVKAKRFWKINAIQLEIKAKRGRTWKFKNRDNAKLGGLVKELSFLFVTRSYSANCYILHSDECQKK